MPPNHFFDCGTCGRGFPAGWTARQNHLRSTGHSMPDHECDSCHRWFGTEQARDQHMRATSHFGCARCSETWASRRECADHELEHHFYCAQCDRHFDNSNNVKMHLNSRAHRGRQIQCPSCSRLFTTAAGLTHHLEAASCPGAPDLGRDGLYRLVRSKDPRGIVSKNLIEWTGSSHYEANRDAWNGSGYECPLCSRDFATLVALNQHLNSPTHQQVLYHCPNPSCRIEFKSLAGFVNHLESESCRFTKFEHVQRNITNVVSGDRLICFS